MSRSVPAAMAACLTMACCGMAGAAELPTRKPGLWEIRIKITGGMMPTATMRHCSDDKADREMSIMFNPMSPDPCPKRDIQKLDDRHTIDAVCRDGNRSITLHSDITGDFASSYKVVTETKIQEREDSEPAVSNMTLEARYVGACGPGEKPGDVIMAGGLKVNVKDMDAFRRSLKR